MKSIHRAVIIILAIVSTAAQAADRYVAKGGTGDGSGGWSSATSNILEGVLGVSAGCTVYVSNGVYTLTNQLTITNFTIRSFNNGALDRDGTVINGNWTSMNKSCFNMIDSGAVVDGFTITNGTAFDGGGVYMTAGTLRNCLVTGNQATNPAYNGGKGGGVYATGSGSMITNCEIVGNAARNQGGGLFILTSAQAWNCRVLNNQTLQSFDGNASGGGVVNKSALLCNSVIASNSSPVSNAGGGVLMCGTGIIRNCLITRNTMRFGAGIFIGLGGIGNNVMVENCTIETNIVSGAGWGTGIAVSPWVASTNVFNNVICYSNTTYQGAGSVNSFSNCCLASTNGLSGTGNITNDPAFVNSADGDYHLSRTSPCVNTGTNQAWMAGAVDLEGNSRIDGGTRLADMGCYEYVYPKGTLVLTR